MTVRYRLQGPQRLEALANRLFFALRSRLRWQRPGYRESGASLPDDALTRALLERYHPAYAGRFGQQTLQENLIWLELLDGIRDRLHWRPEGPFQALDVGCKNFYYAPTLLAFWQSFGQPLSLTGLELDAYRVYRDRHSRADYAAWYAKDLATFVAGDALDHHARYHAISLFYPFVLPGPLVKWGLPLNQYRPQKLLAHVWSLLEPGGCLLVVNQGHGEWAAQKDLYTELGLAPSLEQYWRLPKRPTAWISAVCKSHEHGLV